MSEQQQDGIVTFQEPAVMAFPALLEARKFKRNGKETGEAKYGASFILAPNSANLNAAKARIMAVAQAKWPGRNIGAEVQAGNFKLPLTAGNALINKRKAKLQAANKEYDGKADFMQDMVVLKASSKFPPKMAVIENGTISPDLEGAALTNNKAKFYFGCEVLAQVNFVAYDGVNDSKDGVTAYVNQVVSLNRGKKLTSGASAAETFAAFAGKVSAEDPTDGLDDEIPF